MVSPQNRYVSDLFQGTDVSADCDALDHQLSNDPRPPTNAEERKPLTDCVAVGAT